MGGIVGKRVYGNNYDIAFKDITFDGLSVTGAYSCGGLIGIDAIKNAKKLEITGCNSTANGISVIGGYYGKEKDKLRHGIGSFVGMTFWCRPYIDGKTATSDTSDISVSNVSSFYDGDYMSSVGGLIGYSGSGAEIKNINLVAANSNAVIGGTMVSNAAGFIGFTQAMTENKNGSANRTEPNDDDLKDCVYIENCKIQNLSIKAKNGSAGFLSKTGNADTWHTKYIYISNCAVIGNANTKPEIKAYGTGTTTQTNYAGGFVGDLRSSVVTCLIQNSYIENYTIEGWHVGGIIGETTYRSVNLRNLYVKDCDIIRNNKNNGAIGGVVGYSNQDLNGYNLKIDGVTFQKKSDSGYVESPSDAGFILGESNGTKINKFVAIGAYNTTASKVPPSVVKTNGTNSSNFFVFADYLNASATDITNESGNKSSYNDTNNVEQPIAPYVTVNPRMTMGLDEFITSDGAGVGVAGAIYAESIKTTGKSNRAYNTWTNTIGMRSGNKTDQQILSKYINDDGTCKNGVFRISDFNTEFEGVEGIENVDNFAMLVVNNDADLAGDITPFIKSYIRMVTNTSSNTSDGTYSNSDNNDGKTYSVVIKPCIYNSKTGKFELGTSGNQGLTVHSGGTDNGKYEVSTPDSTKTNQFSLIDIQFKDPTDTTGNTVAYHLYVPVLTQKTMSVNFYSYSASGTKYLASNYTNGIDFEVANNKNEYSLVESTGTWTTTFIRYEYPKNEVKSQFAWNHSKKLNLRIQSGFRDLPKGTKLILVDPNNNKDAAYTYNFDSSASGDFTLSLSDFTDESGNHFKEQNLSTLLSSQNAVRGDENIVFENYYISMFIPKNEGQTHLVRFESKTPLDVDVAAGEERPANAGKASVDQKLVSFVVLGDLYTHKINELTVDSNQHNTEMTSGNNTLIISTKATITLNDISAGAYLTNTDILHSFYISLTSYESDESISDYIKGIVKDDISSTGTAEYTDSSGSHTTDITPLIGLGGNYVEIKTGDIKNMLLNGDHTAQISTTTNMEFYDVTAFPYKTQEQIQSETEVNIGSVVGVKSNIGYNSAELPYSPITAKNDDGVTNPDSKYYYTTTQNFADLSFNAVPTDDSEDEIGYKTNNRSLLGVNGKYTTAPQLAAKSVYNASQIVDYDFATGIKYTVKLYKKQKGSDGITKYVQVTNISDYLTNVSLLDSEVSLENVSVNQNEYIYQGAIDHNHPKDQDKTFNADFKCRVKTSANSKREYANYKIELTAELIDATNTKKMDYIVYTNALIDPEVIPESNG